MIAVSQSSDLVPNASSTAPDYFCTWNVQGYMTNYGSPAAMRAGLCEASLFSKGASANWLSFYPKVRGDLLFVMDDSWDIPVNGDSSFYGSLQLDNSRFPSYKGEPALLLGQLVKDVKARGWRGLGGWACAQESPKLFRGNVEGYWRERFEELNQAGLEYLKVDWGNHSGDVKWRHQLEVLAHQVAPNLVVEAAMSRENLKFARTYRTYDVENNIAAPETIRRVAELLTSEDAKGSPTVINAEDEVYIAAALGCAYGVMRHPYAGNLPNGGLDIAFPSNCRDLKHRIDEVTRAVRWHRISPPYAAGLGTTTLSKENLTDVWVFAKSETWTDRMPNEIGTTQAPAIVARGLPLPKVVSAANGLLPFVVAGKDPLGQVAITTVGRAMGRVYETPLAHITLQGGVVGKAIGVFGNYASLTVEFEGNHKVTRVIAQDLAADRSQDITGEVKIDGSRIILSGELIKRVGLSARSRGDKSDPGLVLVASE